MRATGAGGGSEMKAVWMAAAAGLGATPAQASVYSDDLGKCLVAKTSDADRAGLVKWIFVAVSANPAVRDMAHVSPAQRDAAPRQAAALMQRLLATDCRPATVAALRYDGTEAIANAFRLLGEVAMRGLMSAPPAVAELQTLDRHADQATWEALGAEAGLPKKKAR